MKMSNAVKKHNRLVRRLRRDFSDSALRNMRLGTQKEIDKLERQLAKLRIESVAYTQALQI